MIRAVRSSTVANGDLYKSECGWPQKKSKELSPNYRSTVSNQSPGIGSMVMNHHEETTSYEAQCSAANLGEVGNLHTCRFLKPCPGASSARIRLTTPLVWLIVFPMATIIAVFSY
ncbi:hypothetical protein TNCV_316191 [Trichonephila clavipes]|nr:hypothetical protein TNCV_316191 [Trichonephila clavipes]